MLTWIKARFHLLRQLPARTASAERNLRELNASVEATEQHLLRLDEQVLPGLLLLAERAAADQIASSEYASVTRARVHTEEAVAAAMTATLSAAHTYATAAADAAQTSAIAASREHAEAAASAALAAALVELSAERTAVRGQLSRDLAAFRRKADAPPVAGTADSPHVPAEESRAPAPVDDALYAALEDRFRGDTKMIADRQRAYLELIGDLADDEHPVLDLGCGRGEWLRLLADVGVPAVGIDSNATFVVEGTAEGLHIFEEDLVTHLRAARDGSYAMITMFQVVEHLPFPVLVDVLRECARVLRPGGVLVAETPNSTNLQVAASTFWLDPTHQRPLHPDLLKFLAVECGFVKVDGWFLHDLGDAHPHVDPVVERLRQLVDGPGDFSLLAWT